MVSMIRNAGMAVVMVLSASAALSEEPVVMRRPAAADTIVISGNPRMDLIGLSTLGNAPQMQMAQAASTNGNKKSPWLAGGLSLAIPGAGQFYAESYWKSAASFAVEVGLWAFAYYWDKKGDRKTDEFQNFADQNWSVIKYAQYAIANFSPVDPNDNQVFTMAKLTKSGTSNPTSWQDMDWAALNRMESAIAGYYSHNLAAHGEQQYYEMIGKYPQFNEGWNDASSTLGSDYDTQRANITSNFLYYAGQRGTANTYYTHATTFVDIALVNHLLSAIDAVLSAHGYNRRVSAEVGVRMVPVYGGYASVPEVKLKLGI